MIQLHVITPVFFKEKVMLIKGTKILMGKEAAKYQNMIDIFRRSLHS